MQDLRNRNIIREVRKFVPGYKISASTLTNQRFLWVAQDTEHQKTLC